MIQKSPHISSEVGFRLAGLADGEGHFAITHQRRGWNCRFTIKMRADDLAILERLVNYVGLGVIYQNECRPTPGRQNNPAFQWHIGKKAETLELVHIFEEYPLWSRKAEEFTVWAEAVRYWTDPAWVYGCNRRGHRELLLDWTPFEDYQRRLLAARKFVLPVELRERVLA